MWLLSDFCAISTWFPLVWNNAEKSEYSRCFFSTGVHPWFQESFLPYLHTYINEFKWLRATYRKKTKHSEFMHISWVSLWSPQSKQCQQECMHFCMPVYIFAQTGCYRRQFHTAVLVIPPLRSFILPRKERWSSDSSFSPNPNGATRHYGLSRTYHVLRVSRQVQ